MTFHILGRIFPTDELIFFRGVETSNWCLNMFLNMSYSVECRFIEFRDTVSVFTKEHGSITKQSLDVYIYIYNTYIYIDMYNRR